MKKKLVVLAVAGVFALGACSGDDNVYSDSAREDFMSECSTMNLNEDQCGCVWDEITENVPEDEAERFLEDEDATEAPAGITEAFTTCAEG